jgi:hypothetical protein
VTGVVKCDDTRKITLWNNIKKQSRNDNAQYPWWMYACSASGIASASSRQVAYRRSWLTKIPQNKCIFLQCDAQNSNNMISPTLLQQQNFSILPGHRRSWPASCSSVTCSNMSNENQQMIRLHLLRFHHAWYDFSLLIHPKIGVSTQGGPPLVASFSILNPWKNRLRWNNMSYCWHRLKKSHSYLKNLEKSRFCREKTNRAVEFASLPTSRFVFSRAKSRLFSIFLVRTRFFSAPPSITPYCCCLRRPWTFSENKGWNDGKFDFPFISTPIKLKKYFSCSHNSILLGHQAHKIAKFWILKKSISRQLGEF